MTTPLFLLRCLQVGLSLRDLDLLTVGMVNDIFVLWVVERALSTSLRAVVSFVVSPPISTVIPAIRLAPWKRVWATTERAVPGWICSLWRCSRTFSSLVLAEIEGRDAEQL